MHGAQLVEEHSPPPTALQVHCPAIRVGRDGGRLQPVAWERAVEARRVGRLAHQECLGERLVGCSPTTAAAGTAGSTANHSCASSGVSGEHTHADHEEKPKESVARHCAVAEVRPQPPLPTAHPRTLPSVTAWPSLTPPSPLRLRSRLRHPTGRSPRCDSHSVVRSSSSARGHVRCFGCFAWASSHLLVLLRGCWGAPSPSRWRCAGR